MNHKNDVNTPVYSILATTVFQKESFCTAKGLLFVGKRTRFGVQKDSFWKAKGLLFEMLSVKCGMLEGKGDGNVKCLRPEGAEALTFDTLS